MIDEFGKVMVYVENPRAVADFWVQRLGFVERATQELGGSLLSVEVAHTAASEVALVIFDRAVVETMSPELDLATPSILFASRDVSGMRAELAAHGVNVGDLTEHGGTLTFNFADPEGNYFAVQQIAAA